MHKYFEVYFKTQDGKIEKSTYKVLYPLIISTSADTEETASINEAMLVLQNEFARIE